VWKIQWSIRPHEKDSQWSKENAACQANGRAGRVFFAALRKPGRSPRCQALGPTVFNLYRKSVHINLEVAMPTVTTYTNARATLAALCEEVASTREPVIIKRRNAPDVALVSADELESLIETAHLMRSPKNAKRLLTALSRAQAGELPPSTVEELRKELGLAQEEAE
jgi:antitoxin YefM